MPIDCLVPRVFDRISRSRRLRQLNAVRWNGHFAFARRTDGSLQAEQREVHEGDKGSPPHPIKVSLGVANARRTLTFAIGATNRLIYNVVSAEFSSRAVHSNNFWCNFFQLHLIKLHLGITKKC